jgi:hypothetical protein
MKLLAFGDQPTAIKHCQTTDDRKLIASPASRVPADRY